MKPASDALILQDHLRQPDQKHEHDKENAVVAARELADRKMRDVVSRASELQQLERLLGATVASSGLKQLDLRQLNVSSCNSAAVLFFISGVFWLHFSRCHFVAVVIPHSAFAMQEVRMSANMSCHDIT
jgi:hypothetical protein